MGTQIPNTTPSAGISPKVPKYTIDITLSRAAVPGYAIKHDKNSVVIGGEKLGEVLEQLYESGFRRVEAVVEVAGRQIVADATIYKKYDKKRNRTYYWLYVLQPGQAVLRALFDEHRRGAAPRAKKPLPLIIHQIAVPLKTK